MRALPAAVALTLLLPLFPVGAAQTAGEHYLNVDQPIVRPGETFSVSLMAYDGGTGSVRLTLLRLTDPAQARDLDSVEGLGGLTKVDERSVSLDGRHSSSSSQRFNLTTPGVYVVESQRGDVVRRAFVQVTDVTFVVKEGSSRAIVYAFSLRDGSPVPGARVVVNGTEVGTTGADGVLPIAADLRGPVVLLSGASASLGDLDVHRWETGPDVRVVTQLDRPIYRPGQTVHLKATTLRVDGDMYVPFNATALQVRVLTYARGGEQVAYEATLVPNAFGSIATSFTLAEDAPIGEYSVRVVPPGGNMHGGHASFGVEAYRKPRIDVTVEPQRPHYVRGDEVAVLAKAEWFFGSPVTRGTVKYEIRPQYHYWFDDCRFCFYAIDVARPYPSASEPVMTGTGELRPDGSFAFTFKPEGGEHAQRYEIQVFVTAGSGEQQSGTGAITVHPSAYAIQLETTSYAYAPGSEIVATATVRDHDGRPIPGAPVKLRLEQERGQTRASTEATTDALGRARLTLRSPASGGGYTLTAETRDEGGRLASDSRWAWIADGRTPWYADESVRVLPEKERYQDGETLRALVISSKPVHVLVTLEGADLHAWEVVSVSGSAYVEFPVRGEYAPSAVVSALVVRPSAYGPNTWQDNAYVDVGPDPRELNVTITPDKPAYRDADDVRLLLLATDRLGNPVQGEFALGVVDESIYRLREDRGLLRDQVYPQRHDVQLIAPWWSLSWGRQANVAFAESALSAGRAVATTPALAADSDMRADNASAYAAGGLDQVRVRQEFPDTALWLPTLTTDADGFARVRLQAPDTLTQWRVTARGLTAEGLVGDARGEFTTRKPLMLEPNLPRFLVQGDELTFPVVVFNHIGEMRDIEVHMVLGGAVEATGATSRRVTLSDGDSVRLDFPVRALENASTVDVTFVALSAGSTNESDAMKLTLPVLPHGILQKAVKAGADAGEFSLPLPPGPYAQAPQLTVTMSASMGGAVLDALPNLLGYPYGCVEQTMSRFMPAVVATKALQDAGFEVQDEKLPEYVEQGLGRLTRFQHADGGWGWWESDATNPYMTAYVVAGLAEAKRAGVAVEPGMLARGVAALERIQAEEIDPDLAAYEAYALALAGGKVQKWPEGGKLSADGIALVGLAKEIAGDRAGARQAWETLERMAIRDEGRLHWEGSRSEWRHHGIRSDVQLTAHALRLMVALDEPDTPLVVTWLAEQRRGAWWSTTKDTAESVLAVVDYLKESSELTPDFEAVVTVGDETRRVRFDERTDRETLTFAVDGASVPVRIEREGEGRLYWSAIAASVPRAQHIAAADQGFHVLRTVTDKNGLPASALVFGEEYVVKVEVRTTTGRGHVMLQSWLPAGVEVVRDSAQQGHGDGPHIMSPIAIDCWGCWWGGSWTNVEVRDDHVAAFATTLPAGNSSLTYRIRAMTPGSYHVLPAHVEEMYHPDVFGRTEDAHLTVGAVPRLLLGSAVVLDTGLRFQVHGEGRTIDVRDLRVKVLDANGTAIEVGAPQVTLLEDGTAEVVVNATRALPDVLTLEVVLADAAVVRRLDLTGSALRYEGSFSSSLEEAWRSGEVVEGASAARSPRADVDPSVFQMPRQEPPRGGGPATPPGPSPEPPTLDFIPLPGAAWLLAAVAVGALAYRRR